MHESGSSRKQRVLFWSPLYVVGILYPVVMGLPLLACWLWLSPATFLGISYWYLGASLVLAAALYAIVGLLGWWETPHWRSEDRPFVNWAERVCRVGKLSRWDGALALGLFFAFALLLILTPFTAAEALLPVVGLLLLGTGANLLRPEIGDKREVQQRTTLEGKRQVRQSQVSQARAAGDKKTPTLRLGDPRKEEDLEQAAEIILDLRWSYAPYGSTKPATRWYEVELPVAMEHYREFRRLDHGERGPHHEGYALRPLALPDEELRELASELELLAREANYCTLDTAGFVLALVQSIPYLREGEAPDQVSYARYPLETLVDGKGSGDCHALLAAALLVRLGFDVLLVYIPSLTSEPSTSARLGVAVAGKEDLPGDRWYRFEGRKYYYVETTSPSARFGEFPPKLAASEPYPLRLR